MSVIVAFIFLAISIVINYYAGTYATEVASHYVTDIILSNIKTYHIGNFFIYGSFAFAFAIFIACLYKPNKIPFTLKSIALFVVIRSIFISLTHIGPYPTQITIHSGILDKFTFGADLFFSGHTGMPYLISLVFWEDKLIRYIFLAFSGIFAVVVLLAHLHYSIDVLAAFFITYTIYDIATRIFKKDRKISLEN